jgi:formate dehydrogenase major subunit
MVPLRLKRGRIVFMDGTGNQGNEDNPQSQMEGHPITNEVTKINRREWLRTAVGGSVGLALDGLLDLPTVRAATQKLKLANVSEFTTSCNFCSCGCGMIAAVREGKLIAMEGDYDHIVNRGSLCVKGISMFATHASPNRLKTPLYRAPGSDHWEDISWDDAIERVAQKIRKTRDATWIASEKVDGKEVPVNRTDAIGFLGGAQNTNEECYLFQKAARLLGLAYVEHQARL